jgi:hypothetical protein
MKSRVTNSSILLGTERDYQFNDTIQYYGTPYTEDTVMLLGDKGHIGYPDLLGKVNVGGDFHLRGLRNIGGSASVGTIWTNRSVSINKRYSGTMYVYPHGAGLTNAQKNDSAPDSFGATAYSRMKPAQPSFNALNAIYELKDIPMMLEQRFHKNNLKNIGSYYLALKFGWEPLLRDVQNFVKTQLDAQKRLKQLMRDNGKPVRRSIQLRDLDVQNPVGPKNGYPSWYPILTTYYYRKQPTGTVQSGVRDRVWANARFRYWLPDGPRDIAWKRRMIASIFGLNPSPSMVYNAIPWSWLVDWFSNVGDVVNNLDGGVADRLAADYFYVMRLREAYSNFSSIIYLYDVNGQPKDVSGTAYSSSFVKTRVAGDPFGFATPGNTLSGMQLSILGALGLSRLK